MNKDTNTKNPFDGKEQKDSSQVISIEVEDQPVVLTRISALFARRGFNIKSLSVAHTHLPGLSRFTIVTSGNNKVLEQIRKQCQKLIHVLRTQFLNPENSVLREFTIVKIERDLQKLPHLHHLVDFYGGRLLDLSENSIIVEFSGSEEKIDQIYQELQSLKVLESIRTGKVGMKRG